MGLECEEGQETIRYMLYVPTVPRWLGWWCLSTFTVWDFVSSDLCFLRRRRLVIQEYMYLPTDLGTVSREVCIIIATSPSYEILPDLFEPSLIY